MASLTTNTFLGEDGIRLTYRQLGTGRPVVLLHGYLLPATLTWVDTGIAEHLAADGRCAIMPDLRGHGDSNPHDTNAYPEDALTRDALALIAHLDLTDYDLGGYSLGARVVARALALGLRPRRAFIGGTGLEPIVHAAGRGENYRQILSNLGTFAPGTFEAEFEGHVKQVGADPAALIRVLDTLVDTPGEALAGVEVPTLVIAGEADTSRGSVKDLAALLSHGHLRIVPGNHFTALFSRELAEEIAGFLSRGSSS